VSLSRLPLSHTLPVVRMNPVLDALWRHRIEREEREVKSAWKGWVSSARWE
jgi:hypothetical protein